jgi:phosphate transport system protein
MTEKGSDAMEAFRDGDAVCRAHCRRRQEDQRQALRIEDRTTFVVASQQPMATDLRSLASILYISTDLERMADHAEGIARINLLLGDEPLPRRLGYLPARADRAVAMLRNSL